MAISHGRASTILPCLLQHPGKTWQLKQASLEFKLQHIGSCFWMECKWYVFEVIWVYHTMGNSPKSCNFNFDHTAVVVSHISSPNIFFCKVGFYYIIDGVVSWRHLRKNWRRTRMRRIWPNSSKMFRPGLQWAQQLFPPFVSYIRRD
jgi:hypothetical protein